MTIFSSDLFRYIEADKIFLSQSVILKAVSKELFVRYRDNEFATKPSIAIRSEYSGLVCYFEHNPIKSVEKSMNTSRINGKPVKVGGFLFQMNFKLTPFLAVLVLRFILSL